MAVELLPAATSLVDLVERLFDRGFVVDPWARGGDKPLKLAGVELQVVAEPLPLVVSRARRPSRRLRANGSKP